MREVEVIKVSVERAFTCDPHGMIFHSLDFDKLRRISDCNDFLFDPGESITAHYSQIHRVCEWHHGSKSERLICFHPHTRSVLINEVLDKEKAAFVNQVKNEMSLVETNYKNAVKRGHEIRKSALSKTFFERLKFLFTGKMDLPL